MSPDPEMFFDIIIKYEWSMRCTLTFFKFFERSFQENEKTIQTLGDSIHRCASAK